MTGTASDVRDVDTVPEPVDQPGNKRQRHVDQGGIVNGAAVLSHDSLKLRERRVRNSAAVAEAVHDLIFDQRQQPDVLHPYREVAPPGGPGEPGGVIGGQRKRSRRAIVIDDSPGGHHRQPFPDVPFVERCARGDLRARCRGHSGHDIEQSRAVAHAHHQGQGGLIHRVEHPLGEVRRTPCRFLSHPVPSHLRGWPYVATRPSSAYM